MICICYEASKTSRDFNILLKDAIHRLVNRAYPQASLSFKENTLREKQKEPV